MEVAKYMDKEKAINDVLKEAFDTFSTSYEVFAVIFDGFCGSNINTIAFVLLDRSEADTVGWTFATNKGHINSSGVETWVYYLREMNRYYLQLLYEERVYVNPKYIDKWNELRDYRSILVKSNPEKLFRAAVEGCKTAQRKLRDDLRWERNGLSSYISLMKAKDYAEQLFSHGDFEHAIDYLCEQSKKYQSIDASVTIEDCQRLIDETQLLIDRVYHSTDEIFMKKPSHPFVGDFLEAWLASL